MTDQEMLILRLMELYDEWRALKWPTGSPSIPRFGQYALNKEKRFYPQNKPFAAAFYEENPHKAFKLIYQQITDGI